jgi:serine/threonine protein kinase
MARVNDSPMGSGPEGPFERRLLDALRRRLPDTYRLIPNFSVKDPNRSALEYDVVVLAPHAVYVLEAKEWYGRLTGDDTEWLLNQKPKRCPLWLVDLKCKVLKTRLGAVGQHLWVEPVFVIPDETQNFLQGNWADHVFGIEGVIAFLQDASRIRRPFQVAQYHDAIIAQLQGAWAARRRDTRRRIGGYEIVETIDADEERAEYLAKRALVDDPTTYRLRTWRLSPNLNHKEREERLAVIRRPTEAIAKIGRHPNLLQILEFNELPEENEFFEVTEWSDYGTLHGYLNNSERERLTIRERLEIARGVASALEVVHEHKLVHRNLCPETILIAVDRQPRLTDFDRAYIEHKATVFQHTQNRRHNPAYIPPELKDSTRYQTSTAADMYAFGVLLFELLIERTPFAGPDGALAAGGVPSMLPSQARDGIDSRIDALILKLLSVNDLQARPSATEALEVLRKVMGGATAAAAPDAVVNANPTAAFAPGTVIDGMFRVDAVLGKGGFSRVYKVYHLDQLETYAMKLLSNDSQVDMLLHEYNKVGRKLPPHPNIAKMIWMSRLAPPRGTPYILSEYIEGETLEPYCDGTKLLSWSDIRSIGTQLLDALEALHPKTERLNQLRAKLDGHSISEEEYAEYQRLKQAVADGILHRDIKPANILLEYRSNRPKLIDFNIASALIEAKGRGGTPRYWAPDRGQPDWRADMDLFSLGVVLYELVTQMHPFPTNDPEAGQPYDARDLRPDLKLSAEVAEFLLKSVQPAGVNRFQSAGEMRAALKAVRSMHAPAPTAALPEGMFAGIQLEPQEIGKPNYNPYVTRLLTLFSQAKRSNKGTRGLDEIGRLTYVNTRLDDRLAPVIANGQLRLVIVTGNAGDGKTAFLQNVETYFAKQLGVQVTALPTANGSTWSQGNLHYQTNYDGSQDEDQTENSAVLASFLSPFCGETIQGLAGDQVRLIAINEGRLLDFLEHGTNREQFRGLRAYVHAALIGAAPEVPGILLVNLNLRAVTAGARESIVEKQLQAMLRPEFWRPCDQCAFKDRCPLKHNADTLGDSVSGPSTRDRVRRLFEVVHLRRKMHMTIRDVRSALSWLILRDHSCEDVAQLLSRVDTKAGDALASIYYPEAFANNEGRPTTTADDRLVRILRDSDVGFVNAPQLDRGLDHDPASAVPWMTFENRSTYARSVMEGLSIGLPRSSEDTSLQDLFTRRRTIISRWRRWAYFERRDEGWRSMLPYQSVEAFESILSPAQTGTDHAALSSLRDWIIDAISLSEGMRNTRIRAQSLALRVSRVRNPSIRSHRLFPKDKFTIDVATIGRLSDFLEYQPDTVDLVADATLGTARLRVSLDLLEMLDLIRRGYRPSPADMQGLFINLLIFRNELLNLPFDKITVSRDDEDLYQIGATVTEDAGIALRLTKDHEERPVAVSEGE